MRLLLATIVGTVVLVAWGMLFWGMLAPRLGVFHALPDAPGVTATLVGTGTTTGTYFMPWPRDTPEAFARFVRQHETGPFYRLSYVTEGVDPNSPGKLMVGTLHYVTVAAIAVGLSGLAGPQRRRRFAVVVLAGLLGSDFITVGDPIWFHMPWDYVRGVLVYEIVSWILLGAVTARLAP
jgi:hypothetical protein